MALLENILKVITPREVLLSKLEQLATYKYESRPIKDNNGSPTWLIGCLDSAENMLIYPNTKIINELNRTFIDLMRIDYGYRSKRLVPIQIIRNLIDLATFLYCYILYNNKRDYLNKYKRGEPISKFKIRNKYVSYNKLLEGAEDYEGLDKRFEGLKKLYLYCCTYVHSGYDSNKASSVWDCSIDTGYIGFLGKEYKLKEEDFTEWLVEGMIDRTIFDYEEECDIVDACIWVNQILTTLISEVREIADREEKVQCDTLPLLSVVDAGASFTPTSPTTQSR